MRGFYRRLLALLGRALPKQQIRGDGGVQIGKTGNNVTVNVINQHHTTVIQGCRAWGEAVSEARRGNNA